MKLKVVLDSNILLVSISSKSKYHWIFERLRNQEYELFITNDILHEYEENISEKFDVEVVRDVLKALIILPNVHEKSIYYNWNFIFEDKMITNLLTVQ